MSTTSTTSPPLGGAWNLAPLFTNRARIQGNRGRINTAPPPAREESDRARALREEREAADVHARVCRAPRREEPFFTEVLRDLGRPWADGETR